MRAFPRVWIAVVLLLPGLLQGAAPMAGSHRADARPAPAPASVPAQELAAYLTPQRLAPIEQGRTINLVCLGQGSPTIILAAGLDGWSFGWGPVQPTLATHTRVCAWDRAGYGFSSPSPEPQDVLHTTKDLERALKSAGIRGPYLMVGHSTGAYESLLFADRHRESVVGMVLVDPDIPNRAAVEERLAPLYATMRRAFGERLLKQLQDCATGLRDGTVKAGTPEFERCTAARGVPPIFPRLRAAMARLNADPARLLTQLSTNKESYADRNSREVMNAGRHYGDMPLIVLTAERDEATILSALATLPPGTPGARTPEEAAQLRAQIAPFLRDGWVAAHDAYAAVSTRGRRQLVDSTHNMIVEKPDVVVSAVIEVMKQRAAVPSR
jgi:pimeloyl-ACP methyl ester carboxylesterase